MTFETSSTLLYFLTKELQVLQGGKIEKIYQIGKDDLIFRIYKEGEKKNFRICAPHFVCVSEQEYTAPTNPPGFCMFLRKYLTNARIESVEQKDFERILLITFTTKNEKYYLIIELFKPGNVILCKKNEEGILIVLNSFERQSFKDRVIHARKPYEFPPELINPLNIEINKLKEIINSSDRNLVKTLAAKLGLGGVYAEEIISVAELDKDIEKINDENILKLKKGIDKFFSENIKPTKQENNVYPTAMNTRKGELVPSISSAIDSLNRLNEEVKQEKKEKKVKDKTQGLIQIQEKMIRDLEIKIDENQKKGEFIYNHYQEFAKLINDANKIREKDGLDALEKVLKQNKKFKSLNKKDKEITLNF